MKKSLLVLFASILFVFNGSAQCTNDAGTIMLNAPFVCQSMPAQISTTPATNISANFVVNWQQSYDGQNWIGASGSSTNDYFEIPTYNLSNGASYYRRKITDLNATAPCNVVYSNALFVNPVIVFPGVISGNDTICGGQNNNSVINSIQAGNTTGNSISYSWFQSTGNNNFTPIAGATNETYNPSNITVTTQYKRMVLMNNSPCSSNSNTITINVMNCGTFSTNITGTTSIGPNQTATYSVPATVGMQYVWTVTGGTITSGQGTNIITVIWDGGGSANLRTTVADYSVSVVETDATPESRTTTQPITAITTGINKGLGSTGISVFPNPIKNQFTVEMPTVNSTVNYTVYSTSGVQMQAGSFNATASGNTITTQLPAGMYQLVLNYDGVYTSTRLVVVE